MKAAAAAVEAFLLRFSSTRTCGNYDKRHFCIAEHVGFVLCICLDRRPMNAFFSWLICQINCRGTIQIAIESYLQKRYSPPHNARLSTGRHSHSRTRPVRTIILRCPIRPVPVHQNRSRTKKGVSPFIRGYTFRAPTSASTRTRNHPWRTLICVYGVCLRHLIETASL